MREPSGVPGATRRLSIHTGTARVDLVLSATVAVGLLIPAIVDALAGCSDIHAGQLAVRYQLFTLDGAALDASKTLAQSGVRDGTTLTLTRPPTDFIPPLCDDIAEAVSSVVAGTERCWTRPIAQSVGAVVASCWTGVGAVVLLRTAFDANAAHRAGCVGVAAAASALSLAAAAAGRVFSGDRASLMLGLMATGFAALAGLVAVPGGPGAPNALVAAAAGGTCAVLVRIMVCDAVLFEVLACFATTCLSAVLVCVLAAEPLPFIGPGLATISLAMIEAAPTISVMLARLSPAAPIAGAERLRASALRAHRRFTSMTAAFSASAALGAVSTLFRMSLASIIFAAVIGGVMMLRARTHHDVVRAAPLVVCGAVIVGAAFIATAAGYPHRAPHVAVLATALGWLALYAGFVGRPATVSPVGRRSLELLERFAFMTVVPLTFWLCGLFGAVRGVNLS